MKKLLVVISVLILLSCQYDDSELIKNPQPEDVRGMWESLSIMQFFPYALLHFDVMGNGVLVAANKEVAGVLLTLESFESLEKGFNITVIFKDDENREEPEVVFGSIERGQLCFYISDPDNQDKKMSFCFTKASEVEGLRSSAMEVFNDLSG